MHKVFSDGDSWSRYDRRCCDQTRFDEPKKCMYLCGKTRDEWMEEEFN